MLSMRLLPVLLAVMIICEASGAGPQRKRGSGHRSPNKYMDRYITDDVEGYWAELKKERVRLVKLCVSSFLHSNLPVATVPASPCTPPCLDGGV